VQPQPDFGEAFPDGLAPHQSWPLADTVHHGAIPIALDADGRDFPDHPNIKCVVHQ
jgi:hypothetical protein